jgi:hypothetical protein
VTTARQIRDVKCSMAKMANESVQCRRVRW